jgi:integrase
MFLAKQKERTTSTTANHYATLLKRMFNLAVHWEYVQKNPAAIVDKYREPPNRERILSREELPRFLKALDQQEDRLSVAAIRLLLFTGCRKGEILSLKWDQVRLDEGRLFLPITKNGQSRSVLLNAKAKEVFKGLQVQREEDHRTQNSEYVFPSRNGTRKGHIHDLRKPFLKVCEAANIDGMRPHDLRHTAASWSIMGGSSLFEVKNMLGHQDISTTQRYTHLAEEQLQKAADNLANMIDQASND